MDHAINLVIAIILALCGLVMEAIVLVDSFLASVMTSLGINPQAQTAILIGVVLLLVIAAVRALGSVVSVLIIVLLFLLLAHRVMPGMHVPPVSFPHFT